MEDEKGKIENANFRTNLRRITAMGLGWKSAFGGLFIRSAGIYSRADRYWDGKAIDGRDAGLGVR